jgi:hypothetical protein
MADMDSALGTIGVPAGTVIASPSRRRTVLGAVLLLTLVALVTRMGEFHNPTTLDDEQFYLLTGKAMLHGELPYVDIWDRKPIGLFLIYAGIAALGGDNVLLYHLAAALAALGTSILILKLGERIADRRGGLAAGVAYLFLLPTMGGSGGQSPVFYNLLIAAAALLTFDAFVFSRALWPRAIAAMTLCGLAIQVKPTCIFEGCFFGLLLLCAAWRERREARQVAALAAAMITIALMPTIAAFATYAALGHFDDMWIATVVSIFTKAPLRWSDRTAHLLQFLIFLGIPTAAVIGSVAHLLRRRGVDRLNLFLGGWVLAAMLGYLSVPNFFDHYALPLMVPFSVAMAPLFAKPRYGLPLLASVLALPVLFLSNSPARAFRGNPDFDEMANFVGSQLHGGCLYVYNGPTALYTATNACRLTRFVFPDHLETEVESHSIPASADIEVEGVFARRPTVVVTQPRAFLARNNVTAAIVERHLACDYRLARRFPTVQKRDISVWVLLPGAPHVCPAAHPALGIIQPAQSGSAEG